MRETICYLPEYFSDDELKAGLKFALDAAKSGPNELIIFVNTIANCGHFMERIFDSADLNKLRSNKKIQINGIKVSLESENTIQKYGTYEVVLAIHGSAKLLEKMDENKTIKTLILLAESRDISKEWLSKVSAKFLQGGKGV